MWVYMHKSRKKDHSWFALLQKKSINKRDETIKAVLRG